MASYVVLTGTKQGVGNEDVYAIVIDDGSHMAVLGDTELAADIRDTVELAAGETEHERLQSVLRGFAYFGRQGPIPFAGSTESAIDPISRLYGV